jgi:GT2 family glycosyltransferase
MKISIIVHNFNRAASLERCLLSIEVQSYRPLELVLLDAGSNDGSLAVIENATQRIRSLGIEVQVISCSRMGVAKSRNFGARYASGKVLVGIDNDACFISSDAITKVAQLFNDRFEVAAVSFRLLDRDSQELDPHGWVYRRGEEWSKRLFRTFTFVGGGFAVRTVAFWQVGGFWDHLVYSREEEELALALIDRGWGILYMPTVSIRHYFDPSGRLNVLQRRSIELKNGILVLWRRFPLILAIPAILGRILTISLRLVIRQRESPFQLAPAILTAAHEWRKCKLKRLPVRFRSTWTYTALHFRAAAERQ